MNTDREKLLNAEHAAEWFARSKTIGPRERAQLVDWCRESPQHPYELILAKTTDLALRHMLAGGSFDAADLVRRAGAVHTLEPSEEDERRTARALLTWPKSALAALQRISPMMVAGAVFGVIVAAVLIASNIARRHTYDTPLGEPRSFELRDGTIARAAPGTRLTVHLTAEQRVVRLTRGEAVFHVATDRARPFLVVTELATARAVGTIFAMAWDGPERVRVSVQEGVVAVTAAKALARPAQTDGADGSITLNAGDEAAITRDDIVTHTRSDFGSGLPLVGDRLVFEEETVANAIDAINRVNSKHIHVLADDAARAVSGIFSAQDPESFVDYLRKQGVLGILSDMSALQTPTPHLDELSETSP